METVEDEEIEIEKDEIVYFKLDKRSSDVEQHAAEEEDYWKMEYENDIDRILDNFDNRISISQAVNSYDDQHRNVECAIDHLQVSD